MLDTILDQIKTTLDDNRCIQVDTAPERFGFVRNGCGFERGLHGFREWWALDQCMGYLMSMGICEFWYTNFHTLHIVPKKAKRSWRK